MTIVEKIVKQVRIATELEVPPVPCNVEIYAELLMESFPMLHLVGNPGERAVVANSLSSHTELSDGETNYSYTEIRQIAQVCLEFAATTKNIGKGFVNCAFWLVLHWPSGVFGFGIDKPNLMMSRLMGR